MTTANEVPLFDGELFLVAPFKLNLSYSLCAQCRSYRSTLPGRRKKWRKIGRDHQESLRPQTSPASRSTRVAITGTTDALPIPKKQISGINNNNNSNSNVSADNPRKNDPLWALLSAFADPGPRAAGTLTPTTDTPVKGAAATAATAAATAATVAVTGTAAGGSRLSSRLSGGGRGAAAAAVATEGGVGAREVRSANASAAAPSDGPLVVSVVATLRSGDSCYRKDKALLEVRVTMDG